MCSAPILWINILCILLILWNSHDQNWIKLDEGDKKINWCLAIIHWFKVLPDETKYVDDDGGAFGAYLPAEKFVIVDVLTLTYM